MNKINTNINIQNLFYVNNPVVWCVVHISVTYSYYLSHYLTILAITIQAAVYISEIAPTNIRGGFTSASSLMMCCGFSMIFFVGTVVSWRTLAIIGAVPCVLQAIGLFFVPESPRWLAKVGRENGKS
ncbi:sugar transporter ERD6-like 11 [Vitis riparia]|uniref:sugar transporter ERD6-like 11 n=1 Tax=Vitis riparia TaxID=96939 RepID=UPI00155A521F|nr:sugar transporter ERD6-like 11 [Vitis riparia]